MKIKVPFLLWLVSMTLITSYPFTLSAREGVSREEVEEIVQKKMEEKKSGKISGIVFGDVAWFARYHTVTGSTTTWEDKTAFWIRRGYFTYDYIFDEHFSGRFRLEINSGDFDDSNSAGVAGVSDLMRPYVKEASLKWKPSDHAISVGMIITPTWVGLVEDHWGYRSVEKTPLDLQGFGSAVDLGVRADGNFGDGKFNYALVVGNGSGTRWEINSAKKVYGALTVKPIPDLAIQAYGDYEAGLGHTDRTNLEGFVGYTREKWRLGTLFNYRIVQLAAGGNQEIKLVSGHGAFQIMKRLWGFARLDHLFDPNPNGNTIQYLPLVETSKPTFTVAGLDFEARKNIHFLPNLETTFYSKVNGIRPRTDIVPRLTFAWNF